jgi:hypothetical protein
MISGGRLGRGVDGHDTDVVVLRVQGMELYSTVHLKRNVELAHLAHCGIIMYLLPSSALPFGVFLQQGMKLNSTVANYKQLVHPAHSSCFVCCYINTAARHGAVQRCAVAPCHQHVDPAHTGMPFPLLLFLCTAAGHGAVQHGAVAPEA